MAAAAVDIEVAEAMDTFRKLAVWYAGLIDRFSDIDAGTFVIGEPKMRARVAQALAVLLKDPIALGKGAYGAVVQSTTIRDGSGNPVAVKYESICGVDRQIGVARCQALLRGISYRLPHSGKTLLELPGPMTEGLVGMLMSTLEARRISPHFAQVITSFIVRQDAVPSDIRGAITADPHPFLFTIMVKYNETLESYLKKFKKEAQFHLVLLALFQIIQALWAGQTTYRFAHNDLHFQNILVQRAPPGTYLYLSYNLNGKIVHMHVPFIVKISDYGYSIATTPATRTESSYVLSHIDNYRYFDPKDDLYSVLDEIDNLGIDLPAKWLKLFRSWDAFEQFGFAVMCDKLVKELRSLTPFISDVPETDLVFTVGPPVQTHKLVLYTKPSDSDGNSFLNNAMTIVKVYLPTLVGAGIPNTMLTPPLINGKANCEDGLTKWGNMATIAFFDSKRMRDEGYSFRSYCCYTDVNGFWDDNPGTFGVVANGSFFRYESYAPVGAYLDPRAYINKTVFDKQPGVPPHAWRFKRYRKWVDPSAPLPPNYESDYHYVESDGYNISILSAEQFATRKRERSNKYLFAGGPLLVKDGKMVFTEDRLSERTTIDGVEVPKYTCANSHLANKMTGRITTISKAYSDTCEPEPIPTMSVLNCNKIEPGEFSHAANPNPRMALMIFPPGYTRFGNTYTGAFIFVEGRSEFSPGPTLPEFAGYCLAFRAMDAINLDGGRSAAISWKEPTKPDKVFITTLHTRYPVGNIMGWVRGDPAPAERDVEEELISQFAAMDVEDTGEQPVIPGVQRPDKPLSREVAAAGAGGVVMET